MPARELRLLTDMFIEGLEQFSDGLISEQLAVSKQEASDFMDDFAAAMQQARLRAGESR